VNIDTNKMKMVDMGSALRSNRFIRNMISRSILNYYNVRGSVSMVEIDPFDVQFKMPRWREMFWDHRPGEVIGGVWDRSATPLEESDLYIGFREHINDEVPWVETTYYQRIVRELNKGTWHGASTEEEVLKQLSNYDHLYNMIRKEGYKSQRTLLAEGNHQRFKPPELCEVLVNVDRNGDWILDDGRHRFVIARLLNIRTIPVCILARHKKSNRF